MLKNPLLDNGVNHFGCFILGTVAYAGKFNKIIDARKFRQLTRSGDRLPWITIAPNQQGSAGQDG
jgi:hypothetical protein